MTDGSPEEREKTVGEIMEDTDRAESGRLNGLWTLTILFAVFGVGGWLLFDALFH